MKSILSVPIPKGSTQRDVNYQILKYLTGKKITKILDIPCGSGQFIKTFMAIFKPDIAYGIDVSAANPQPDFTMKQLDASKGFDFSDEVEQGFDLITSISGVMEFDNTSGFIQSCKHNLAKDGYLIITNDNCFTLRDRITYLFIGKFRRFKLLRNKYSPTWKYLALGELEKIIQENNLCITKVIYSAFYIEDLIFLPFAIALYPLHILYLLTHAREYSFEYKISLFPFKSLLFRHYILVCEHSIPTDE